MDPKSELKALLAAGVPLRVNPQGLPGDKPTRKSAVLILFGRLDSVLASTPRSQPDSVNASAPGLDSRNSVSPGYGSTNGAPFKVPLDLDVLLQRRAEGMRHHAGQIAFPGGGIDPGETPEMAAVREAHEETGIDPDAVEILGTLPEVHIPVSNNLVTPVVGWWSRPSEIAAVDHAEAVEVFRVPVAEMLDPTIRYTCVVDRGGSTTRSGTFRSDAFILSERFGGHLVWGFTSIVLATLYKNLGWEEPWDPTREVPLTIP